MSEFQLDRSLVARAEATVRLAGVLEERFGLPRNSAIEVACAAVIADDVGNVACVIEDASRYIGMLGENGGADVR